jgi:hypothetical protein
MQLPDRTSNDECKMSPFILSKFQWASSDNPKRGDFGLIQLPTLGFSSFFARKQDLPCFVVSLWPPQGMPPQGQLIGHANFRK